MNNDNVTMQDVLRQFYLKYLEVYTPTADQAKAMYHILNCKTGAYGVNISICGECGHIQFHNNSCRDRSCPMCQALSNELWIDAQNEYVLDIDYYHIWEKGKEGRLTQLLFCDLSTPKNDGTFNVYDDIRSKLIAAGVPEQEVAFIHTADTEAKKKELFAKVMSCWIP